MNSFAFYVSLLIFSFDVELIFASLGGLLVSVQQDFPSEGLLETKNWKHACAGVLLKRDTVLTSAGCLTYSDETEGLLEAEPGEVRIYAGGGDPDVLTKAELKDEVAMVRSVIIHPEYMDKETGVTDEQFDFGILLTESPFRTDGAHRLSTLFSREIKSVRKRLNSPKKCSTMTWNFYVEGIPVPMDPKGALIEVKLTAIDQCESARNRSFHNPEKLSKKFLTCAKSVENLPICRVDPGAPIFCEQKLIAIVTNVKLSCGTDESTVVVTGINNAMVFLAEPSLFLKRRSQVIDANLREALSSGRLRDFDGVTRMAMLMSLILLPSP